MCSSGTHCVRDLVESAGVDLTSGDLSQSPEFLRELFGLAGGKIMAELLEISPNHRLASWKTLGQLVKDLGLAGGEALREFVDQLSLAGRQALGEFVDDLGLTLAQTKATEKTGKLARILTLAQTKTRKKSSELAGILSLAKGREEIGQLAGILSLAQTKTGKKTSQLASILTLSKTKTRQKPSDFTKILSLSKSQARQKTREFTCILSLSNAKALERSVEGRRWERFGDLAFFDRKGAGAKDASQGIGRDLAFLDWKAAGAEEIGDGVRVDLARDWWSVEVDRNLETRSGTVLEYTDSQALLTAIATPARDAIRTELARMLVSVVVETRCTVQVRRRGQALSKECGLTTD